MSPASAPTQQLNVQYMLGQLMDRTECLPDMKDDVSTLKSDFRHLREDFDAHTKATDDELKRIRGSAVKTRVTIAGLRGKLQGIALVLLLVKEAVVHLWPKAGH